MADRDEEAELTWASERHLRIRCGAATAERTPVRVREVIAALKRAVMPGLIDITPAYATVLLEFSMEALDVQSALAAVRDALADAAVTPADLPQTLVEIPVCYDRCCAPDLDDLARIHGRDVSDVIRLHTQPVYTVQFVGFSPGFGYLSGLSRELATPRLDTPRVRVPAGSVGIAEEQTGIYPSATPGGWRLIGRTPLIMFDAQRDEPSLLSAGDRVRFVPIDLATFNAQMRGRPDHE